MSKLVTLEICCSDIESVIAAKEGGADYIELCCSIETGGITPSVAMIREAAKIFPGHTNVLIRPRPGDFLYTPREIEVILCDISAAIDSGASGIVCGALTEDGSIDMDALRLMLKRSDGVPFTFHRAFDVCRNPDEALGQLIESGCESVLTSGCAPSAEAGASKLRDFVIESNGRIAIKAGAGITAANVRKIIDQTGVKRIHASAKEIMRSRMQYCNPDVSMGAVKGDEYSRIATSSRNVLALKEAIAK